MRIASMELHNWMPYAGKQQLHLDALAYAVVARYAGDPERSNWGGKTALLLAPRFALYGVHSARTEDGWITDASGEGGVTLELVDGQDRIRVERTRKRGKSTSLVVRVNDLPPAKGDEAQAILVDRLGLTSADFAATCYFAQRAMAQMVLAKPQDRMDIVGAWLRLEPLVRAEEMVRKELSDLSYEADQQRGYLNTAKHILDTELERHDDAGGTTPIACTPEQLQERLAQTEQRLADAEAQKIEVGQRVSEARKLAIARSRVAEYERIVEAGKEVKAKLEGADLTALAHEEEETAKLERDMAVLIGQHENDVAQKRKVALGQFDGTCPVAGIACPATDTINKKSKATRDALIVAQKTLDGARHEYSLLEHLHEEAVAARRAADALKTRLTALRDQVRALKGDYDLAKGNATVIDSDALEVEFTAACNKVVNLRSEAATRRAAIERVQHATENQTKHQDNLRSLEKLMSVKREALVVFGKLGAQKRVAELALRAIEDGANGMLQECAIDLTVEVQWSREGTGLAKACEACGHPFGTSAKIKACERCGTARGPLLVNKLDIVLSDRSGAAEDLAGASIQLAASAWLREERGSAWGMALIDEPYGALDAANRKAFSTHLASMLAGRYGFEQAFVVSHSPDTVTQLPGRIVITSVDGRATVQVV